MSRTPARTGARIPSRTVRPAAAAAELGQAMADALDQAVAVQRLDLGR
jgi:hypothetical protein